MKRLTYLLGAGVLAAALAALAQASPEAAKEVRVSFTMQGTFLPDLSGSSGSYTRLGRIPAGTFRERATVLSENPFRVRVVRTLDPGRPGGDTVTMRVLTRGVATSPAGNLGTETWVIVSGTGRYAAVRGSGVGAGIFAPPKLYGAGVGYVRFAG